MTLQFELKRILNSAALIGGFLIFSGSFAARASTACVDEGVRQIESILKSRTKMGPQDIALAPATAYDGLSGLQLSNLHANGTAESAFIDEVGGRMGQALGAFLNTAGSREQVSRAVALASLGSADRRQVFQILRRPKNNPSTIVNGTNRCNSSSCADMAIKTEQVYVMDQMRESRAADIMSILKLRTDSHVSVYFCETSASCRSRDQLMSEGGVVRRESRPQAMRTNVPYTARKAVMGVEVTSLFESTSMTICGHPATLMTAILLKGQNSFDNASSVALSIENENHAMVFSKFQAYVAGNRGKIPGTYLDGGFFGHIALSSSIFVYNTIAESLGLSDRIDGNGVLK